MSEIRDDLLRLVRDLVADHADGPGLWRALLDAGVSEVGAHGNGDLGDLVACVREVGRAPTPVPLVDHVVAEWAVGPDLPGTTIVATTREVLGTGRLDVTLADVGWFDEVAAVVVLSVDRAVLVAPDDGMVEIGRDIVGRPSAHLILRGVEPLRSASWPVDAVGARLRTLAAAELLGTAEAAVDLTRDYVSTREQFGGPLLRIPAVAHTLGRMRSDVVASAAAVSRAVAELPSADRIAASAVAGTAGRVAAGAHQLHGAIGVTNEYPLHRLTRRLWVGRDRWEPMRAADIAIGRRAISIDEDAFFDELTAPAWWLTEQAG